MDECCETLEWNKCEALSNEKRGTTLLEVDETPEDACLMIILPFFF